MWKCCCLITEVIQIIINNALFNRGDFSCKYFLVSENNVFQWKMTRPFFPNWLIFSLIPKQVERFLLILHFVYYDILRQILNRRRWLKFRIRYSYCGNLKLADSRVLLFKSGEQGAFAPTKLKGGGIAPTIGHNDLWLKSCCKFILIRWKHL